MTPEAYLPVLLQALAAIGFAAVSLAVAALLGRRIRHTPEKDKPYECGKDPIGPQQPRFSVKFYRVAMLFVLFDIEVVLLYPWAVVYKDLVAQNSGIFWTMAVLIGLVAVGLVYEIQKGALDWSR